MVTIGDVVEFIDPVGASHKALVTTVFTSGHPGDDGPSPSVNLVFVSDDESKSDQYGRQIERNTSVVHESNQYAHGMFWREPHVAG
jgi:hypothetical protein